VDRLIFYFGFDNLNIFMEEFELKLFINRFCLMDMTFRIIICCITVNLIIYLLFLMMITNVVINIVFYSKHIFAL